MPGPDPIPVPASPECWYSESQSGPGQMMVDGDSFRTSSMNRGHAAGKAPYGHSTGLGPNFGVPGFQHPPDAYPSYPTAPSSP